MGSAEIERKVIKTNKGTLILAKTQKYGKKSVFFSLFLKGIFFF